MSRAGLESDIESRPGECFPADIRSGILDRLHLGMGTSGFPVPSAAQNFTLLYDDSADRRIRAGSSETFLPLFQGRAQIAFVILR